MGEPVVILGAGIIGLYTAYLLIEDGKDGKDITFIAKHMPGDLSSYYTSPIAGAHFSCAVSGYSDIALRYNRISYPLLGKLFKKFESQLEDAGLDRLPQIELFVEPINAKVIEEMKKYAEDFHEITDNQWLEARGAKYGLKYLTYNFYSPKFLVFMKKYLESQGAKFVRGDVALVTDAPKAAGVPEAKTVFNCTGVLASKLGDVPDGVYPIRGQVVSVKAPWIKENISLEGTPPTYIIPRVHSLGRVILGGYYEEHNWTEGTLGEQTKSILERTCKLNPELLKNGPLEILEERAAFRPGHKGGARIEREAMKDITVIHNYGAAGTGYQSGLAMASDAISLYLGREKEP